MATMRSWLAGLSLALLLCALVPGAREIVRGDQGAQSPAPDPRKEGVTAVSGPSWLSRLGLRGTSSNLGRGSGVYGPGSAQSGQRGTVALPISRSVTMSGADLYRLNCQACHRAEGTGAPPEIKSVLAAVEGSSLAHVRGQLRAQGKEASGAAAQATKAKEDLYQRILKGGQRMPPLDHLQRADVDLLYGYLATLAHTPEASAARSRTVSIERLGEHIVKGTCHICHDSAGARPTSRELLAGAVPPFSVLLKERSVVEVVRKVRQGAPVMMGEPPFPHRGRMPMFHYLKDEDVAAAYMFLNEYPPQAASAPRK